jgi:hypothetical protein
VVTSPTVLVALKANCDGCSAFHSGSLVALSEYDVVLVARSVRGVAELESAPNVVYEAPELLDELGVRWPPAYVLIDGSPARVVFEGVAFAPEQVADELSRR